MKISSSYLEQKDLLHRRDSVSGLSLVELLVLIAVIALLMSLTLIAVKGVTKRASQAQALSNFRQLGAIFMTYASDNRGHLPGPLYTTQRSGYRQALPLGIGAKLWEYMGIARPSRDYLPVPLLVVPELSKWRYSGDDPNPAAYSVIRNVPLPDGTTGHPFGLSNNMNLLTMKLFHLPDPARTWALWERGGSGDPLTSNRILSEPLHGKQRTVLFFDGHVELVPTENLPAYSSP